MRTIAAKNLATEMTNYNVEKGNLYVRVNQTTKVAVSSEDNGVNWHFGYMPPGKLTKSSRGWYPPHVREIHCHFAGPYTNRKAR